MANELAKMRGIRTAQVEVRTSLKNREEANKAIRTEITPIWTADKEKRTERLEDLTKALVEGREKVRNYQKQLKEFKADLKATNRVYDLTKC
jgi:uncharacterized protein (DUF342 family)